MANRIPLIVDSSSNQIKELPDGDSVILGDSEKLILGDGSDLQLYHSSGNSYIDNNKGALFIRNNVDDDDNNNIILQAKSGEYSIICDDDGAVTLYHDNSAKVATTTSGVSVTGNIVYTGGSLTAEGTLTDGATISWDVSTDPIAKVTLAGNRTMAAPSNPLGSGQYISLLIIQDGTGSRTLTWNNTFEFKDDTAPTLTTTATMSDLFTFRYYAGSTKWVEVGRNQNLTV